MTGSSGETAALASLTRHSPQGEWEGRVTLPLPDGDVPVLVVAEDAGGATQGQREALRYALALTPEARIRLEETLYADYEMMNEAADALPPIAAADAVWEHVELIGLAIPAHRGLRRRYFVLEFEVDWEVEHGAEVLFRNGLPVELDIIGSTGSPENYETQGNEG